MAIAALCLICACSGEREYINYRGFSMGISAKKMADSLQLTMANLAIDTARSGENSFVLVDTMARNFSVTIYHQKDTINDILENYTATYNDSTTQLWQTLHDEFEKEFGWPNMGKHGDLHKEAYYDSEKGTVVLTLLNTYSPTVSVRYSTKTTKD